MTDLIINGTYFDALCKLQALVTQSPFGMSCHLGTLLLKTGLLITVMFCIVCTSGIILSGSLMPLGSFYLCLAALM